MPYLTEDNVATLQGRYPSNKAELTYVLSRMVGHYLEAQGLSFDTITDATAALHSTQLEVERGILAPYEDTKLHATVVGSTHHHRRPRVDPFGKLRRG